MKNPWSVLAVGQPSFVAELNTVLAPVALVEAGPFDPRVVGERARDFDVVIIDGDAVEPPSDLEWPLLEAVRARGKPAVVISSRHDHAEVARAALLGAADYVVRPYNTRELIARFIAVQETKTRVCCLGGGTGLFNVLLGLKSLRHSLVTSIVAMSDDGGSSGRLRDLFGVLPPGDVRRSLVALSNAPMLMNQVLQYRFEKGGALDGHSVGNLFLTALSEIRGSMLEAVRGLGDILNIHGVVVPIAGSQTTLCARFSDGTTVRGETGIDVPRARDPSLRITQLWHEPEVCANISAYSAIMNADLVVIGPGDLYTSIITNLLVQGVREALAQTRAKKLYITNLMTKPGETAQYDVADHVRDLLRYLGADCVDYVLVSNTETSHEAIADYAAKGQDLVVLRSRDELAKISSAELIVADIGHKVELVRHDGQKVRDVIQALIDGEGLLPRMGGFHAPKRRVG